MSLLKWKEFAKSKTELGNKINYVHDLIKRHNIGQETSQESFKKVFKPVTTKLDDVVQSNLRVAGVRKRPTKKGEVPDYGIDIEDEVEDMNLGYLFDEQPVPPQQEKQIGPVPPPYEEFYVYPEYYQTNDDQTNDDPPDYDEYQPIEYAINPDLERTILDSNEIDLPNYESVQKTLDQVADTNEKKKLWL